MFGPPKSRATAGIEVALVLGKPFSERRGPPTNDELSDSITIRSVSANRQYAARASTFTARKKHLHSSKEEESQGKPRAKVSHGVGFSDVSVLLGGAISPHRITAPRNRIKT